MSSVSELHFDQGIVAYKNGDIESAVRCFQEAADKDPNDWNARFYLAMALGRAHRLREAKQHFMTVRDVCPDGNLRARAAAAVAAMNATMLKDLRH